MTVPVPVAADVWVDWATRPATSRHPADRRTAAALPPWRAQETLAGRWLLRTLLARLLPTAAQAPLVAVGNGRPVLSGWPRVGVSVSHDGGVVAAAVSLDRPVGVDVQLPPEQLSDRLARRCLRGRTADLHRVPPTLRTTEFAWVWSVQEACVKARGTGLAGRPWSIDVPVRPTTGRWRELTWVALRDHTDIPISCAFGERPCSAATPPT
jgi:4'-phosphopantetheinyl transferase